MSGFYRFPETDVTTLLNTSIVKVLKPIADVSSCHCCLNSNAFIPQHQCIDLPQLIVIKVLGMLPLKSAVQSVDFGGSFLFLARFIDLN